VIHVAFWANDHHKVRVFPIDLAVPDWWFGEASPGQHVFTDGGELDWHLARYCKHLQGLFPGNFVQYQFEPANDSSTASLTVLEKDRQEYFDWCLQADEPVCLV
jgi:hypothetical protein